MRRKESLKGSFRDLINRLGSGEKGFTLDEYEYKKTEDLRRLRQLNVPHFKFYSCPYLDFTQKNKKLIEFLSRHKGFFVRVLPTRPGLDKKFTSGLCSYEECRAFADPFVKGNEDNYEMVLSEWAPDDYGGVIIFEQRRPKSERFIKGEIAKSITLEVVDEKGEQSEVELTGLQALCLSIVDPSAGFVINTDVVGHIEDKVNWYSVKTPEAKSLLWKTFRSIPIGDSFNPLFKEGYFEFTIANSRPRFVDFKANPAYFS